MVGYVRNDTSNNIADGNIINASDLDGEFDAVQAAFSAVSGHKHDGSAANGAPIEVVGPTQDITVTATQTRPKTTNIHDLGSTSLRWRSIFASTLVDTVGLLVSGNVSSNLTPEATGTRSLGRPGNRWLELYANDLYGATLELSTGVNSNLTPTSNNTRDLGTTAVRWKDLYLAGGAFITGAVTGNAVTQSNVDGTAGRLTKVGDYGMGGLLPLIGNCAVTDNSIVPAEYSYDTSLGSSGGPTGLIRGRLSHRRRSVGGGETQIFTGESDTLPRTFVRARITGAWGTWAEELHRRDMVGLVNPTPGDGAIFERWDDVPNNQGYTIFADGTFIYHRIVTTDITGPVTLLMPVSASVSYPVVCQATIKTAAPAFTYANYVSGNNIEYAAWNSAGTLVARSMQITVTGRVF